MPVILVVIIRSLISYFVLLVFMRLIGKQQMAELTFADYVVGITIGSIAATLSVQLNQNTTATLVGLGIWTLLPILLSYWSVKNVWIRKVVEGEATVVVENGKILENHLSKLHLSIDDLLSQLRSKNIFNIADVEFALFETNGKLSVQLKSQKQPLTPSDLQLPTQYAGLPTTLIEDGKVLKDALKSLNLAQAWLQHQLAKQNIRDFSQVSLAQLDTKGNLYVDMKGDQFYYIIPTNG
ncbi:uncharacterized membrane protein YcaP (DUF421 family) [Hydrogenispora ethanolica]|uniref:Uncharacterized membrane protein YcaP (DUF421 family) n=1 Tax=Hydrogenispora ethanolica TaxID=1082276 RepID=A0A4R1RM51_HYDET|nr:DUF421 domain-containing protein [Hydrogenispora ethanolica]TCL67341.1 uncharacterized membrane protein YcaP (DUF421 family) [Hydrogenispora ethanolica]